MRRFFHRPVCLILLAILCAACFSLSGCSDYVGDSKQVMDHMNIASTVAPNGDMKVTETWTVTLHDRGKPYSNLYRTFSMDTSKVDDITNIAVYDNDRNQNYVFAGDVDPEDSSVTSGGAMTGKCYLHRSGDTAELGWFMPELDSGTRTFAVTYTLKNIIQVYHDTAVLYTQFLSENFSLPITSLTGTVRFPQGGSKNALRAWLHTTANGGLTVDSPDSIHFSATDIPAGTLAEVRLCMLPRLFPDSKKVSGQSVLQGIVQEEQKWSDDTAAAAYHKYLLGIIDALSAFLILAAALIALAVSRRKYRRHSVETPEYTRDIPPGNSPAGIAHLFYFYSGIGEKEKNRMFSATLLSLARKGYVSFSGGEKELVISMLGDTKHMELTGSERAFYRMLSTVGESSGNSFTMGEFKRYAEKHYTYIDHAMEEFLGEAERETVDRGYEENRPLFLGGLKAGGFAALILAFVIFGITGSQGVLMVYIPLALLIGGVMLIAAGSAKMHLSEKGEREFGVWQGLKHYMLDFSRMKEYGVPELSLWEEYLVYATMMGISKEVCKQLKLVYPELSRPEGLGDVYMGSYLPFMFGPHFYGGGFGAPNVDFGAAIGSAIGDIGSAATRLAHPPSNNGGFGGTGGFGGGGFGGGGFSGGGGGFGGGGGGVR